MSLEKIFVFEYSETTFHVVFTWNMNGKSVIRTFWGAFFGCSYCLVGAKIHLDVALQIINFTWDNASLVINLYILITILFNAIMVYYSSKNAQHRSRKIYTRNDWAFSAFTFREHQQKTFVRLSRFWSLRWWGVWGNLLKKGNLGQKSIFQIMLHEALKISEKW